jgi:hypothetical protein
VSLTLQALSGDKLLELDVLRVLTQAGGGTEISARTRQVPWSSVRGEEWSFKVEGEVVAAGLSACANAPSGWRVFRYPRELPEPRDEPWVVLQRRFGEEVVDYVKRVVRGVPLDDPSVLAGQVSDLGVVLPEGSCVLRGLDAGMLARLARVHGLLASGSATFAGFYEGADGRWKLYSYGPTRSDPNHSCELDRSRWSLSITRDPRELQLADPGFSLTRTCPIETKDASKWTKAIRDGTNYQVSAKDQVPSRPTALTFSGAHPTAFCSAVCLEIERSSQDAVGDPDAGSPAARVVVTVRASDHRPQFAAPIHPPAALRLLARISGKAAAADGLLLEVVPPGEDAHPLSKQFPKWKMAKGGADKLLAASLVPGYVREDYSAFAAEWASGDWVLLEVRDGALPVILGSLQKSRDLGPDSIRLSGAAVTLVGCDDKGAAKATVAAKSSSQVLATADQIDMEAKTSVSLQEGVLTTTSDAVSIKASVNVDGTVDVK